MSPFTNFGRIRILLSLCLGILFAVSIWQLVDTVSHDLQTIQKEGEEYRRSPGCSRRSEDIDPTLPPCSIIPAQVVAKHRDSRPTRNSPYGHQTINENTLTLEDTTHQTRKVENVRDSFWDVIVVGDVVQAKVWKGEVQYLEAKGESSGVIDWTIRRNPMERITYWVIAVAFSLLALRILWYIPVRSRS